VHHRSPRADGLGGVWQASCALGGLERQVRRRRCRYDGCRWVLIFIAFISGCCESASITFASHAYDALASVAGLPSAPSKEALWLSEHVAALLLRRGPDSLYNMVATHGGYEMWVQVELTMQIDRGCDAVHVRREPYYKHAAIGRVETGGDSGELRRLWHGPGGRPRQAAGSQADSRTTRRRRRCRPRRWR